MKSLSCEVLGLTRSGSGRPRWPDRGDWHPDIPETSFGHRRQIAYGASGLPEKIELVRGDARATIDLDGGRPIAVRGFDGGEVELADHRQGSRRGLLKQLRAANGLVLRYAYDDARRVAAVDFGDRYRLRYTYDPSGRVVGVVRERL